MVEANLEAQMPAKGEALYVVRLGEEGTYLGFSTEKKFSGPWLVCFV